MKLDHNFFFVSKLSEDPKKKVFTKNWRVFVFEFKWKAKKKVFTVNWRVFVPEITLKPKKGPNIIQRSDADRSPIIKEEADVDPSQIIGGGCSRIIGGIYTPNPTGFGTPVHNVKKARVTPG